MVHLTKKQPQKSCVSADVYRFYALSGTRTEMLIYFGNLDSGALCTSSHIGQTAVTQKRQRFAERGVVTSISDVIS